MQLMETLHSTRLHGILSHQMEPSRSNTSPCTILRQCSSKQIATPYFLGQCFFHTEWKQRLKDLNVRLKKNKVEDGAPSGKFPIFSPGLWLEFKFSLVECRNVYRCLAQLPLWRSCRLASISTVPSWCYSSSRHQCLRSSGGLRLCVIRAKLLHSHLPSAKHVDHQETLHMFKI